MAKEEVSMTAAAAKRCFVVSAFGSTTDEQRRHKQVLRHLVRKVLDTRYEVVRADEIDDEGLITNQIIEHLLEDDLVVADLTGLNPNVFYEIAVRHAARKPIVHLITRGEEIPFDVANMRAVPYALDDPDILEEAQEELERKVSAIEASGWEAAPNPISAAKDVWLLRGSDQPEVRQTGELLAAVGELRDEVRGLGRRIKPDVQPNPGVSDLLAETLTLVEEKGPISAMELASQLHYSPSSISRRLLKLRDRGLVQRIGGGKWVVVDPM
jgi:DNA-binding transcriptional ArsR family regulator